MIFLVVVVITMDYATAAAAAAAAADDVDAVFLIEIKIDQGVIEVGSSSNSNRSSVRYCC